MRQPLTKVLLAVFAKGFYRVHVSMLLIVFIAMVGVVPPQYLIGYHRSLMLSMDTSLIVMLLAFVGWLTYAVKSSQYVSQQLFVPAQQFLFYSSNAFSKKQLKRSWFYVQLVISLPIIVYGLIAVMVGVLNGYYLLPICIVLYLIFLNYCSSVIYTGLVNKLIDGSSQSVLIRLSSKWRKPYFSLYIYHIFDRCKIAYIITKCLSWLIITGMFYVFADVKTDQRVAGITILAVITAHAVLIFEERRFEETALGFSRNLPYSSLRRFLNFCGVYLFLLIPEDIWLFSRFNPLIALELLLAGLSIAMLFHGLLYWFGLNMEKYLKWILGIFVILFWAIMFKVLWLLIILNIAVAFAVFYIYYYRYEGVTSDKT